MSDDGPAASPATALAERVWAAYADAQEIATIYLGDRLGLYEALRDGRARTPGELAAACGLVERYVREWLEHQAVAGILTVDDPDAAADQRRFTLPAGHADVLADRDDPAYCAPAARIVVSLIDALPDVMQAFRAGGGVPFARYGADVREAMDSIGRVGYLPRVAGWLATIPDVDARLQARPPARVADIACGAGWAAISVATAYPSVLVDGFDLDPASIELARRNLAGRGLDERVRFAVQDVNDLGLAGQYDLATMFDALHDMAYPVPALRAIRRLLGPGGSLFVGDGKSAERFTAPGDQQERMTYTASILHCLPVGLAYPDAAGTGAAMRPETVRRYAADAGFASAEIVPIEDDERRFYRLRRDG